MSRELYLFRFGYSWPAELAWVEAHPDSDLGEASEALFIRASSSAEAEALGQETAEAFVRALFGRQSYSWRQLGFAFWIEDDPEIIARSKDYNVPILESSAQLGAVAVDMANRHQPRENEG